jgi:hypothetical protein
LKVYKDAFLILNYFRIFFTFNFSFILQFCKLSISVLFYNFVNFQFQFYLFVLFYNVRKENHLCIVQFHLKKKKYILSVNQKEEKNGENLPESSLTFGLFFLLRQFKIKKALSFYCHLKLTAMI